MPWTKDQSDQVLAVLRQKLVRCPVCQAESFAIHPDLTYLSIGAPNPFEVHSAAPGIIALCKSCGYVMLFNPLLLGLQGVLNLKESPANSEMPAPTKE